MAGPEGVHASDRLGGAELQAAAVHLLHHGAGDGKGRAGFSHQAVVGRQAEVDAGPHLKGMGAVGIERGAIAAQAIGHAKPAPLETLKARLFNRFERTAGALISHHGGQSQQAGVEVAAELVCHHHRRAALGIDFVKLAVPEQQVEVGARLLQPAAQLALFAAGV